jgi:YVTN family beta-propeller protein
VSGIQSDRSRPAGASLGRRRILRAAVGGMAAVFLASGVGAAVAAPLGNWLTGSQPYGVAVSTDGKTVYVVNTGGLYLGAIDTTSGVQRRNPANQTISTPKEVVVDPSGTTAYVASIVTANNTGFVIPVRTSDLANFTPIQVGRNPWAIAITPNGTGIYVGNRDDDSVSIIDGGSRTVVKTLSVGDDPFALAASPEGDNVYVANTRADTVTVISTGSLSVERTINVGDGPQGIAVTKNGKLVVTANRNSGTVSVIERGSNTVSTFSIGGNPFGIAIARDSHTAFVTNADSSHTITVVDLSANKVLGHIQVPGQPGRIVASSKDDRVFAVMNPGAAISVISYPTASAPADQTVAAGTKVTFSSTVTNKPDSVSWQLSADNGNTWHNLTDGNTAKVTFTATSAESGNLYRLSLHDATYGDTASSSAKLTVTGSDPSGGTSGGGTDVSSGPSDGSTDDSTSSASPDANSAPDGAVAASSSNQGLLLALLAAGIVLLLGIAILLVVVLRRSWKRP